MADTGSGVTDYPVLVITLIVGATVLVLVYISSLLKSSKGEDDVKSSEAEVPKKEKQKDSSSSSLKSSKKKHSEKWVRDSKQAFSHPWLLTSLKGHSGEVLDMDFSSNGKFLATCAEDRAVLIWSTKDWNQKDHKSLRINIEFDHAQFVKWSPDCKAFIVHKAAEKVVEVYKVAKKADGWISGVAKALTFPKHHEDDVVGLGIACNGKYIMSCSDKNELVVWDLKGEQLAKVDTYLMTTICAQISPCARFVVASGFAPDVKVWEVKFSKLGEFQQVSRAFELTGHSSGVYSVGFSADSSRMATVSKDGTWKAFNTKIEYEKGEDPHLLSSGKYNHTGSPAHIAMSPNGEVVVVASGNSLAFYSVQTGECDNIIEDIYSGPISCLLFDSLGKYVLTGGEKHVRVFHNVTGYRATIASIQAKMRQPLSSAQKERMEQQIQEAEMFLKSVGETR
ncbi:transducin beta-like protein 2 isoform X3 [Periplaneta americana]|uniref:transducin beta-like protein 2 isoform X3 n=1 Tax=Periplaneta americana TaxID=6978 RepID=UPI0037E72E4C